MVVGGGEMRAWFQDLVHLTKSTDAQAPYLQWLSTVGPVYPGLVESAVLEPVDTDCFGKVLAVFEPKWLVYSSSAI